MQLDKEFYNRTVALTDQNSDGEPPLEKYLRSLLGIFQRMAERTSFDENEFFGILAAAYKSPPQDFDQEWSMIEESDGSPASYDEVAKTLKRQIAQLRSFRPEELATAQIYLENGECWNNFTVNTYLECAAAGVDDNISAGNRPDVTQSINWDDIRFFLLLGQSYE
jgi:hypothetical protein